MTAHRNTGRLDRHPHTRAQHGALAAAVVLATLTFALCADAFDQTVWLSGSTEQWSSVASNSDINTALTTDITNAIYPSGAGSNTVTVNSIAVVVSSTPTWSSLQTKLGSADSYACTAAGDSASDGTGCRYQGVDVSFTPSDTSLDPDAVRASVLGSTFTSTNAAVKAVMLERYTMPVLPLPDVPSSGVPGAQQWVMRLSSVVLGMATYPSKILLTDTTAVSNVLTHIYGSSSAVPSGAASSVYLWLTTRDVSALASTLNGAASPPNPRVVGTAIEATLFNNSGLVVNYVTLSYETASTAVTSAQVNEAMFAADCTSWEAFMADAIESAGSSPPAYVELLPTTVKAVRVPPPVPAGMTVPSSVFSTVVVSTIVTQHVVVISGDRATWQSILDTNEGAVVDAVEQDLSAALSRMNYVNSVEVTAIRAGSLRAEVTVTQGLTSLSQWVWNADDINSVLTSQTILTNTAALYPTPTDVRVTSSATKEFAHTLLPPVAAGIVGMSGALFAFLLAIFIVAIVYACLKLSCEDCNACETVEDDCKNDGKEDCASEVCYVSVADPAVGHEHWRSEAHGPVDAIVSEELVVADINQVTAGHPVIERGYSPITPEGKQATSTPY